LFPSLEFTLRLMLGMHLRLWLYKLGETDKAPSDTSSAASIKTESPSVAPGVRGDSMLVRLAPGRYQLQMVFENPGGTSGFPQAQGDAPTLCEEMSLEMAIEPVKQLESNAGAECGSADSIPTDGDLAIIKVGTRFNMPRAANIQEAVAGRGGSSFYVHVKDAEGGKGMNVGEYSIQAQQTAVLRAQVWSDFLLDDVSISVHNTDGSLLLAGVHAGSLNKLAGVIMPGEYVLKLWLPLSASKLLRDASAGQC
jgi:hypothetical protein